jgi:hypothetical protein
LDLAFDPIAFWRVHQYQGAELFEAVFALNGSKFNADSLACGTRDLASDLDM